jgi:RNA polymerase sigma-70 factor (ECF subfamily)
MPTKPPFNQLVEAHSGEIFHYLHRMLGQTQAAEDALQDAYVRAFRAYDRLDDEANTRAWLYRIAGNVARTQLKRDHRVRDNQPLQADLEDNQPSVLAQVESREQLRSLAEAIERLPHKQRSALILRKYQSLSYDEIGLTLGCTAEAARANVYQAVNKLRYAFSQEVHDAR